MKMKYINFLEIGYIPRENDVLAAFYVEPAEDITVEEAAGAVASESSIGTWTDLATIKQIIWDELSAKVYAIEDNVVYIAYPEAPLEGNNIPKFLSSILGNFFGMKAVKALRLLDIIVTSNLTQQLPGPAFGVQGVREILNIKHRPLIGTIVKPKLGLSPKEQAEVVYNSLAGGLDLVKDDENLTHQVFSNFEERVLRCLEAVQKAEKETGEKKAYLPNITAPTEEMLRRAEFVKKNGGTYVMIDIVTAGFSGLQTVRDTNTGLIIHAHRAMYASFARPKNHGIHILVLAKLSRLAGVPNLPIEILKSSFWSFSQLLRKFLCSFICLLQCFISSNQHLSL